MPAIMKIERLNNDSQRVCIEHRFELVTAKFTSKYFVLSLSVANLSKFLIELSATFNAAY